MIELRRAQLSFGDGLIAEEVSDLREAWMRHADQVLADEQIVASVYDALAKRRPQSRSRGRKGTPAEMVLRLLVLKHVRNWSYEVLEREVRANLVYRDFTRVGGGKMPDAKTMGRWGVALGPEVVRQIHERMVRIALDQGVVTGRRMRVDTTVVETDIHYPTDSSLLGDGVRVLTRVMKRVTAIAGRVGTVLRDRSRSVKLTGDRDRAGGAFQGPAEPRAARGPMASLLATTSRVVGQAKRFATEIVAGLKRSVDRAAAGAGRPAPAARRDAAARAAGDEADQGAPVPAARRAARASSSACSSHRLRSSARARRASPPSSARWSSCRKPRTRS